MGGGGGRCLFKAERLLTFSAFRMGAYSRWALIPGWALIRINTAISFSFDCKQEQTQFLSTVFCVCECVAN